MQSKWRHSFYRKISVIEGECQIVGDWKAVKEYAKLSLTIPSREVTYSGYAEMFYDNPTMNASEKGTMRLYNQAIKNLTHMLVKQAKKEFEKKALK